MNNAERGALMVAALAPALIIGLAEQQAAEAQWANENPELVEAHRAKIERAAAVKAELERRKTQRAEDRNGRYFWPLVAICLVGATYSLFNPPTCPSAEPNGWWCKAR